MKDTTNNNNVFTFILYWIYTSHQKRVFPPGPRIPGDGSLLALGLEVTRASWFQDQERPVLIRRTLYSTVQEMCNAFEQSTPLKQDNTNNKLLVPSNIVACFRVGLVRKKIPEFSWLHCGRRHLLSHVTVRDRTMACHFFLRPTKCFYDGSSASMRSLWVQLCVCLLLLSLAINTINALWHPHTPVLSADEREIWAVKIVRSSCQRCKTWIFCIKISSIVWVETY